MPHARDLPVKQHARSSKPDLESHPPLMSKCSTFVLPCPGMMILILTASSESKHAEDAYFLGSGDKVGYFALIFYRESRETLCF